MLVVGFSRSRPLARLVAARLVTARHDAEAFAMSGRL